MVKRTNLAKEYGDGVIYRAGRDRFQLRWLVTTLLTTRPLRTPSNGVITACQRTSGGCGSCTTAPAPRPADVTSLRLAAACMDA
jgi:hypothetical protein